jgi:hypothetical protein
MGPYTQGVHFGTPGMSYELAVDWKNVAFPRVTFTFCHKLRVTGSFTEKFFVKVAILHELVNQDLQPIFVAKSFKGTKMPVMEAAQQSQFVAEL